MSASSCTVGLPQMKDYVLTESLGTGTYATVYKAVHKGKQKGVVAVKCIKRSRLTVSSMENLLTEIKVMKQLQHEHIVQLSEFEWDTNYIFLIMEYCSGGDLSNFIRSRNTLAEVEAKYFLQQLACALQFLRSKGIAHMDLKPQNLLLHVTASRKYILKVGGTNIACQPTGFWHSAFIFSNCCAGSL
ncbi:Serine/threonine-protein kinase ULK3 [Geodia barretti]|uniref:non-specific serine/threonine protein kinase n=2 Tax=Geodia barretti TaxID=519541 RepID=A0AA35S8E8_GEOBA|nr:Serine/threonine-protein kinase ULK3 [Geodia barretti]